ncbi:Rz1-like lysis system protein LysC [Aeromonas hydrophila]|uniref:Rz1-like lysis system protein LysC n=1 Tax=Aeromonas hydrophila TaxID=644 RepID=UPI003D223571
MTLFACSSPPPRVVTQQIKVLPPVGLMPACPEPEFNGTTWGEAVAFIPTLQGALRRCQTQLDTLNHWINQEDITP